MCISDIKLALFTICQKRTHTYTLPPHCDLSNEPLIPLAQICSTVCSSWCYHLNNCTHLHKTTHPISGHTHLYSYPPRPVLIMWSLRVMWRSTCDLLYSESVRSSPWKQRWARVDVGWGEMPAHFSPGEVRRKKHIDAVVLFSSCVGWAVGGVRSVCNNARLRAV